jgi:ATP-dependent Lhr-like helicase
LLDERIQRWIWQKQWTELKDAQERAIPLLVAPGRDVIIAAATASGKTEAAFFPILTRLCAAPEGALAMYVSPLKALINDQWDRLEELCEHLDIAVTPWHGDVAESKKRRFLKQPRGCLLITPESLEGLLGRHGHSLQSLFGALEYVVVDELHAFLEDERGKQLQSLLHRIEISLGRRVVRVGLSATLGEMSLAAEFLRPGHAANVEKLVSVSPQDLKIILKGVREPREDEDDANLGLEAIADDLFRIRGANNLIFPNSRRSVELVADALRARCEQEGVPNEFWPHHGSLSKEIREEAERALKSGERPATAVATTTLELGIDIGAVRSVAQIGPAPSVASLRQRLGRSGRRRGEPAILRAYCMEAELDADSSLSDQLREGLIQTAAQIQLLVRKWFEPPSSCNLHLSTLIQQLLALITERGGVRPADAWEILCASSVFPGLTKAEFAELLKELAAREFLMQESSGLLLHGVKGERAVNHYSFLAAFVGDQEFRVVTAGKMLGSLPLSRPVVAGSYLILAGRRWRVLSCIPAERVIEVEPAKSGRVPKFDGGAGEVHDEVRREMRKILESGATLPFVDAAGTQLLTEAQNSYRRLELERFRLLPMGRNVHVLTWLGDAVNDTLATWLTSLNMSAANEGLSVVVFNQTRERVFEALTDMHEAPNFTPQHLAQFAENLIVEKWDGLLPEGLLRKAYGWRKFDIDGARTVCAEILES